MNVMENVLNEKIDPALTEDNLNMLLQADEGFFLNGHNLKFKGVCMHHDLGALGTAMNRRALERQLEMLRKMGCNAIRTSHNPPTPELLEICDRMGFLVIDEAFNEWKVPKVDNGYHIEPLTKRYRYEILKNRCDRSDSESEEYTIFHAIHHP
jgi:beta-galactosidase